MKENVLTLDEFTYEQLRSIPHATGMLSALLRDIGLAAKRISAAVNRAGLHTIRGAAGVQNVHDEAVQQLDLYAHQQLREVLKNGHSCAGILSEEMREVEVFEDAINNKSKYVVAFDPLDGSSNIDTNMPIGTIFGVYKRCTTLGTPCTKADFLQPGTRQVAAGYILYGPATLFVYATRRGVNGFTLDPAIGAFCRSQPNIRCPATAPYYSVNHGYLPQYNEGVQRFVRDCQSQQTFSERYAGSMVADLHRTLLAGGIFLYPATAARPNGKLRLLYECNPFAFILEVAGGKAVHDGGRVLDIQPGGVHATTPMYAGSESLVKLFEQVRRG